MKFDPVRYTKGFKRNREEEVRDKEVLNEIKRFYEESHIDCLNIKEKDFLSGVYDYSFKNHFITVKQWNKFLLIKDHMVERESEYNDWVKQWNEYPQLKEQFYEAVNIIKRVREIHYPSSLRPFHISKHIVYLSDLARRFSTNSFFEKIPCKKDFEWATGALKVKLFKNSFSISPRFKIGDIVETRKSFYKLQHGSLLYNTGHSFNSFHFDTTNFGETRDLFLVMEVLSEDLISTYAKGARAYRLLPFERKPYFWNKDKHVFIQERFLKPAKENKSGK